MQFHMKNKMRMLAKLYMLQILVHAIIASNVNFCLVFATNIILKMFLLNTELVIFVFEDQTELYYNLEFLIEFIYIIK